MKMLLAAWERVVPKQPTSFGSAWVIIQAALLAFIQPALRTKKLLNRVAQSSPYGRHVQKVQPRAGLSSFGCPKATPGRSTLERAHLSRYSFAWQAQCIPALSQVPGTGFVAGTAADFSTGAARSQGQVQILWQVQSLWPSQHLGLSQKRAVHPPVPSHEEVPSLKTTNKRYGAFLYPKLDRYVQRCFRDCFVLWQWAERSVKRTQRHQNEVGGSRGHLGLRHATGPELRPARTVFGSRSVFILAGFV